MKTVRCFITLFILAAALIGLGCPATYRTTRKSELNRLQGKGPLRALSVDSLLYTFETFSYDDSTLTGIGTVRRIDTTVSFEGSVPFRRIAFIERLETDPWKAAWVIPMVGMAITSTKAMFSEESMFTIARPTAGGSCPFVYSYDGSEFMLEAESFGTSVAHAFEAESFSVLQSLVPLENRLKVRIRNERPETHLLNRVRLFVADVPGNSCVVLDTGNVLWPNPQRTGPSAASDHSGRDILGEVARKDGRFWASDRANTSVFTGFRDQLSVEFDLPVDASDATLTVDAINTDLIVEVFNTMGALLGDATLDFYDALERDAQLQEIIRNWTRECGLKIEVREGAVWKDVGTILPEANVTSFSRAVRLRNLDGLQNPLCIRLSSLTDAWRIDAVSADFTPVAPIPMHPLDMISVHSSTCTDWEQAVALDDSAYAIILPPHYIDVTFDATEALRLQRPVYVFAAKGYLYEWFPRPTDQPCSDLSTAFSPRDRVRMLKRLIAQEDLFLPGVYAARDGGKHDKGDNHPD